MQALREDYGLDIYIRALRFLSIRLRSRPETATMAVDVDAMREKLRASGDAYEDALERRVAATVEIEYRDSRVDQHVLGLARQLNVLIGGNREDPRYKKLFPVAPTAMVKPVGGDEQATHVAAIVERISTEAEYASLAELAAPIKLGLTELEAATQTRKDLYVAEAKAQANRRATMDDARRTYRLMHPRLTLVFPDDPALVETFFAVFTKPTRPETTEPVVVDGPGNG